MRAFPLVFALTILPLCPAAAQFGGIPWSPGMPQGQAGSPLTSPGRSTACRQLLTYRDDTQKHGQALQAAGKKKAPPDEICKLFKALLGAESKMIKNLEENSALCGVPPEVIKQVKAGHTKASQIGKQVCEIAGQQTRPFKVLNSAPERPCEALWARLSCPLDGEN